MRVDSEPIVSSPLRYLQNVISSTSAAARAHADPEKEVWELRVWDPKSICLTIFTLFSPGHLIVYYILLPPETLDPRPSLTIVKAMAFGALLTVQLRMLKTSFSQQAKDSALIQSQVMHEYDTKYVQPSLHRIVRDVGVQTQAASQTSRGRRVREVDTYAPTTLVKRTFVTNPNPNYARHYDPDSVSAVQPQLSRRQSGHNPTLGTPVLDTPAINGYVNAQTQSAYSTASTAAPDFSSPLKPHHEKLRERTPARGDGGSMGVYTHAASPLKKAVSNSQIRSGPRLSTPGTSRSGLLDNTRRRDTGRF